MIVPGGGVIMLAMPETVPIAVTMPRSFYACAFG